MFKKYHKYFKYLFPTQLSSIHFSILRKKSQEQKIKQNTFNILNIYLEHFSFLSFNNFEKSLLVKITINFENNTKLLRTIQIQ